MAPAARERGRHARSPVGVSNARVGVLSSLGDRRVDRVVVRVVRRLGLVQMIHERLDLDVVLHQLLELIVALEPYLRRNAPSVRLGNLRAEWPR